MFYQDLQYTSHFLLILRNQLDAINVRHQKNVLWDVQVVWIYSEYIMMEGRKLNVDQGQKLG